MNEIHEPTSPVGTVERQVKCRAEMDQVMRRLISAAVKLRWLEAEVAMTLADAAEDHVIALAGAGRSKH